MAYALKDRVFISVLFNGVEFPLDKLNSLDYVHIGSSVRQSLPILSFSLTDVTKFLTVNNFLVDGTLISVVLGKNEKRTTYNFRLFSFRETAGSTPKYQIRGYLDSPLYWSSSTTAIKKGTTSEILAQLAKTCGLRYEGVPTVDSQFWIPHNLPIKDFAQYLCERAWVDDLSCMALTVLPTKVLRYRNVAKFNELPVKALFTNGTLTKDFSPMLDHQMTNRSGFFNASSGYQDQVVLQSISEEDTDLSKLSLTKNSSKLMMNSEVRNLVSQNRIDFAPLNVGNVHQNFEKARYQNKRLSGLFTLGMDLLTSESTEADVLDVVNVDVELSDVKGSRQYSGKYLVTSKVLYLQGPNYFEKFELTRHGLNESRETTQV